MTTLCSTRQLPQTGAIARIAMLLVAVIVLMLPAHPAAAGEAGDGAGQTRGYSGAALMLHGNGVAESIPAMRLGTDIDVTVTGTAARVRVTQAFRNTSSQWMAADYRYPLPEDGAVDSLKMVVGNRVIVGRIEPREQARAVYERAMAEGRKAGLVEQQRPNLFTTSVANVGPGETVLVAIEYQAPIRPVDGRYALRMPLVVGPRYVPPHSLTSDDAVRDARAVTASPVLDPDLKTPINPVSITVHLDPGFVPVDVTSRYHPVEVSGEGAQRTVRLSSNTVPADRDFELDWRAADREPAVGLFRQRVDGADYAMATIVPPKPQPDAPAPPREMVFVIDNSGSMGGASMRQAKASLLHALDTLRPTDRFNIIRFDDTTTQLFETSVRATPEELATARRFTRGLAANGGTEMLPALKMALDDAAPAGDAEARVRQIVFLTDGAISNEAEMLAVLGRDGGRSRVFPVGIGSAPNTYLMDRMATIGRGTYTHIGTPAEVEMRMTALLDKLRHPALRNISLSASDDGVEFTPAALPDIYAGEPLVVLGRSDTLAGQITVSGDRAGQRWSTTLDLAEARPSDAVAKLWARRRIQAVETERTLGEIDGASADRHIADLGLRYGLVTSQTSLVAEDRTPSRPADAPLTRAELPINLPAGWDFDTLFGQQPGNAQRNEAPDPSMQAAAPAEAMELPQTATGYVTRMAWGLLLLSIGALGLWRLRRRDGAVECAHPATTGGA